MASAPLPPPPPEKCQARAGKKCSARRRAAAAGRRGLVGLANFTIHANMISRTHRQRRNDRAAAVLSACKNAQRKCWMEKNCSSELLCTDFN